MDQSNLESDWKICNINFKKPKRLDLNTIVPSQKIEIISIIEQELNKSFNKFKSIIHELNYLQSGQSFIHYKPIYDVNVNMYQPSITPKQYFIDDNDDSDNEYFDSEEIINRVIAEEKIINRVKQLQDDNCWSLKMLSKHSDPTRPLFHWDLFIKEMKWQHSVMSSVRQVKRVDAKKISINIAKYIKEKESQTEKLNKEETLKAKKQCSIIAKSIREWWKQMEKIVQAKHKFRLDAKRQEALNTHLGKVLETTEKYMEWLTEDIKGVSPEDKEGSVDEDPEFLLKDDISHDSDDEETIAKEEDETTYDINEEIESLKKDHAKSLEEILKELPDDYFNLKTEVKEIIVENVFEMTNDVDDIIEEDFNDSDISEDFEETLDEQETYECDNNNNEDFEIKELENDAEVPLDDLLKMYHDMYNKNDSTCERSTKRSLESEAHLSSDNEDSSEESSIDLRIELDIKDTQEFPGEFEEISEVALSTQPKGFTLASTEVQVEIPNLLKGNLREYQHVGLDWLAAIYEKRLNGVLADEMGLGKTIQTIALLAYMACEKLIWGPHLVVVPTSVVLNWEIEFKKWCPGFKILTYFGSAKERKEKRKGWTKTNAFHVCITSYKLAIQDCAAFKRKKWKYMILDEAQNIKNFKSQRWQTLLTFNSQRRLLLTGTPLQNNLMELWSLMHFLMPNIFQSHREFNEWFGNPLSGMIEGSKEYNEQLVLRLHKVLRPFILRRLKKDVEKQMPQKYNHIIMCNLSKRQRFLYDDYMSMSSTSETLASGQFMNVLNILMQLRKVCNHPNLFEERPTLSPFSMVSTDCITYHYPKMLLIDDIYINRTNNGKRVLPLGINSLADMALDLPKFVSERILGLRVNRKLIEDVDQILTADWVTKHKDKNSNSELVTSFIPGDLIDFLNNSEPNTISGTSLPTPQYHGLLVRRSNDIQQNLNLPKKITTRRHNQRINCLRSIAYRNTFRSSQLNVIGPDVISLLTIVNNYSSQVIRDVLQPKTLDQFIETYMDIIQRFNFVIPSVISGGVKIHSASSIINRFQDKLQNAFSEHISNIPDCLVRIRQRQLVQFPETSLIEYDCGKLQVLVNLLSRLKFDGHRCLIFTQMTRMLDILEQFLSYHGYKYLRLDGTTKIEQRQIMMDQFNKDDKIFIFILSTRSGGVGVNLTGADTVIFYDSDWNPTMDAQAQDRCHRIGQTRDVNIYRLISRMTIEENILKKANEKRYLNEMAIEGGQFNMSFLKGNTLQDIFKNPSGFEDNTLEESSTNKSPLYTSSRGRIIKWKGDKTLLTSRSTTDLQDIEKSSDIDTAQLEAALEEVEEESDRLAAKITKAEVKADLLEFDESVPWDDTEDNSPKTDIDENKFRQEMESQIANFNSQLDPIQRYGVGLLEHSLGDLLFDELEREETNIENSKQTWHLDQIKALHEDQEQINNIEEDDMMYIYGKYDPYAAQKQELAKLRREEEFHIQEEQRREKEVAQLEKDKADAQVWAQEQHFNALKRKYCELSDDGESNTANDDSLSRSNKERKVVVARLELPDESITIVNSSHAEDYIPCQVYSSSKIRDSNTLLEINEAGRPCGNVVNNFVAIRSAQTFISSNKVDRLSFNNHTYGSVESNSPFQNAISQSPKRKMGRPPWKNITRSAEERPPPFNSFNNNINVSVEKISFQNAISQSPKRKMGRPPWKNVIRSSGERPSPFNSTITRKIGRPCWKTLLSNSRQMCFQSSRESEFLSLNYSKLNSTDVSNIEPQNLSSHHVTVSPTKHVSTSCPSTLQAPSHLMYEDPPIIIPGIRKRKGRVFLINEQKTVPLNSEININKNEINKKPCLTEISSIPKSEETIEINSIPKKSEAGVSQNEGSIKKGFSNTAEIIKVSESKEIAKIQKIPEVSYLPLHITGSSSIERIQSLHNSINGQDCKKNSFKIPVKTLSGERKLFSAPLLLMKTKPVFIITRKIEDEKGNVYTQNLTYPLMNSERFNEISANLTKFAPASHEK